VVGSCQHKVDGRKCGPCHDFAPIPPDEKVIALHLRGMVTAGAYQIGQDGSTVRWLCLDFDDDGQVGADELRASVVAARAALAALQVPTVPEASGGKGWRCHVWGFFLAPTPAIKARVLIDSALKDAGLSDKTYIERFPKQSRALNGYGNLVKVPFGVNRKTGKRSYFFDADLRPIHDTAAALDAIQLIDPAVTDYVIDVKHLDLSEPSIAQLTPARNFDLPTWAMERVIENCWYFREWERQQADPDSRVHYEDWWNYLLMMSRFGEAGLDRILRLSALDGRFDAHLTVATVMQIRDRGYHAPSCRNRLRAGPGLIHCPRDPLECGAS